MGNAAVAQQESAQSKSEKIAGATVTTTRGISRTEYSIVGDLRDVLAAVRAMFEKYPGLGYGTYVKFMTQLGDGSYGAQMGRSNSCE